MVGGLVEQQNIRLDDQRARQQHATLAAARQAGEVGIRVQLQARGDFRDLGLDLPIFELADHVGMLLQTASDDVFHGAGPVAWHFLHHGGDAQTLLAHQLAAIGQDLAGDDLEQG